VDLKISSKTGMAAHFILFLMKNMLQRLLKNGIRDEAGNYLGFVTRFEVLEDVRINILHRM
jgi:hypothetical protein